MRERLIGFTPDQVERLFKNAKAFEEGRLNPRDFLPEDVNQFSINDYIGVAQETIPAYNSSTATATGGDVQIWTLIPSSDGSTASMSSSQADDETVYNLGPSSVSSGDIVALLRDPIGGSFFCLPYGAAPESTPSDTLQGKLKADIGPSASGLMEVWGLPGGSFTDESSSVTVYNLTDDTLPSAMTVECGLDPHSGKWVVYTPGLGCALQYVSGESGTPGDITFFAPDAAGAGLTGNGCQLSALLGCGLRFSSSAICVNTATMAGPGLVAVSSDCALAVDTTTMVGCGLTASSGVISVNAGALAGVALGAAPSGCTLNWLYGCGLGVSNNSAYVNTTQLAGAGLYSFSSSAAMCPTLNVGVSCGLFIDDENNLEVDVANLIDFPLVVDSSSTCNKIALALSCGLYLADDGIAVSPSALAGKGLTPHSTGCALDVNTLCPTLKFDGATGALYFDPSAVVGPGLQAAGGTTGCPLISVVAGCGIDVNSSGVNFDPTDVAIPPLYPASSGCGIYLNYGCGLSMSNTALKVSTNSVCTPIITGVTASGSCVGGSVVITFSSTVAYLSQNLCAQVSIGSTPC